VFWGSRKVPGNDMQRHQAIVPQQSPLSRFNRQIAIFTITDGVDILHILPGTGFLPLKVDLPTVTACDARLAAWIRTATQLPIRNGGPVESTFFYFSNGGVWLILVIGMVLLGSGLGGLSFVVSLTSRIAKKGGVLARGLSIFALLVAFTPLLVGVVGWSLGLYEVNNAADYAAPEMRGQLLEVGRQMARIPMDVGFVGTIAVLFPSGLAFLLAPPRRGRWEDLAAE
jgi:hypothetical protein